MTFMGYSNEMEKIVQYCFPSFQFLNDCFSLFVDRRSLSRLRDPPKESGSTIHTIASQLTACKNCGKNVLPIKQAMHNFRLIT